MKVSAIVALRQAQPPAWSTAWTGAGLICAVLAAGFLAYAVVRALARNRGKSEGEATLRTLVRQIGAQLVQRGITEEDDLDAGIAASRHAMYQERYRTDTRSPATE